MAKKERIREALDGLPTLDYLMRRVELGWRPAFIEWERDIVPLGDEKERWSEQIPYGLQVSEDCSGLVEHPEEKEIITVATDMIVEDCPLSTGRRGTQQARLPNPPRQTVDSQRSLHPAAAHDPGESEAVQ